MNNTWMPKYHPLNQHWKMKLIVLAVLRGSCIRAVVTNADDALELAYNWIEKLGWNVTITNDGGSDLFDSDFESIEQQDDGTYKAVYLMGSR